MRRITQQQLNILVDHLNEITNSPKTSWTKDKKGKFRSNVGNFHLNYAYGGVTLHRMCNECGGIDDVLRCGYVTKRELFKLLHAYIKGIKIDHVLLELLRAYIKKEN